MSTQTERILPADFGGRYAARFYLTRLAVLAVLILLAVLVPALTVLLHGGSHASGGIVALLVVLALLAFGSTVRLRGALSLGTAFVPQPRTHVLRALIASVGRLLHRR